MKNNNSNEIEENNIIHNSKNLDHFWDDCIEETPKLNNNSIVRKINNNKKINFKKRIYEKHKSIFVDNCYKKLCQKLPNLYQEEQENITKRQKIKNSIKRSLLLYSYGLEVKKANITNISQNKIHKEQEELKLCTWKPKINTNREIFINKKLNNKNGKIYKEYKTNNLKLKNMALGNDGECTFRPMINDNNNLNLKKVFHKSKSISLYTNRENSSFIMRYKKARDEHMIRRFIKLSEKDESYNNSLIDLTSKVWDEQYKNYLNVNNNIQIYDKDYRSNRYQKKINYNPSTGSIDCLVPYNEEFIPNLNKSKKYYICLLKKKLRLIDLEI